LQQVILNLVRNAAEAMDTVSTRERVLRVRSAIHDSGEVLVSIEDSGPGIDPENINRIFDAFYTTKFGGYGNGVGDLSVDHRSPQWAALGFIRRRSWISV